METPALGLQRRHFRNNVLPNVFRLSPHDGTRLSMSKCRNMLEQFQQALNGICGIFYAEPADVPT